MARYIDADALKLDIDLSKGASVLDLAIIVIKAVKEAPTADVVPRSEVAREIFEEIKTCLEYEYMSYLKAYDYTLLTRIEELEKKYTEGGGVAYGGPREGGKRFAEKRSLLYQLKREVHDKAVRPHNAGIDAYISLKVFDAILQGYLNKLE